VKWPVARWGHSCVYLDDETVLMVGGEMQHKSSLSIWLFSKKANILNWKNLEVPESVAQRYCHSISVWKTSPNNFNIMIFGGCLGSTIVDDACMIKICYNGRNYWSIIDILDDPFGKTPKSLLPTSEAALLQKLKHLGIDYEVRLKEEKEKKEKLEKQHQLEEKKLIKQQQLEHQLKEDNLIEQHQSAIQAYEENIRAQEEKIRAQDEKIQTQKEKIRTQKEKIRTQKEKIQTQEEKIQELKPQLCEAISIAQQLNDENQQLTKQIERSAWLFEKHELQMTDEVLERGRWDTVSVANFRGTEVAAKCLHGITISDYNRKTFIQEMQLSAELHHPNVLQFIGAIYGDNNSPIILTELMETNLRKVIQTSRLSNPQIKKISQDICKGLNYIHCWKPAPIIHKDISSSNVLLERAGPDQWKAKVSDCGSVNILSLVVVNPVSPIYSAPEAVNPDEHSPAMDVYSFGILLMEMTLSKQPLGKADSRETQADTIEHSQFKTIVQRCIQREYHLRPTIYKVLHVFTTKL
jgi:phenylalanyl-tRNA synthetase alpha subunit